MPMLEDEASSTSAYRSAISDMPTFEEVTYWRDHLVSRWGNLDEAMEDEEDLYFQSRPHLMSRALADAWRSRRARLRQTRMRLSIRWCLLTYPCVSDPRGHARSTVIRPIS